MSLADSLARLAVFSKTDSHREVLDAATKLLAKHPSVDALHSALVALVRLDRYKAANDLLALHEQLALAPGSNALTPIIAYIQYKIGSPQDVVEAAAERAQGAQQQQLNDQSHRAALHVLAQYYYRAGKSDEALNLYHQLIETCNNSSEAADLAVNERAVLSQLLFANPRSSSRALAPISSGDEASYDQLFNDALVLVVSRRYTEALSLLDKTHDIAQATLADAEADAQETFAELGPIALQKAYTHILLSQHDKALHILTDLANRVAELDANNISDTNIKLLKLIIDTNRLHCLAKLGQLDISTASPHLLYAELGLPNSLADAVTAAKVTTPQLEVLQRNHIRLALATGKRNPHPHALSTPIEIALQAAADATAKNVPQRAIALLERLIATTEAESQPEQQQQLLVHPALGTLLHALYETTNAKAKQQQLLTTIANTLLNTSSATSSGDSVDYARFVALKLMPANASLANALLAHIGEQDLLERKPTEEQVQELLSGSSIGIDVEHLVSQGIEPLITADVTSIASAPVVSNMKLRERKRKRSKLPASYNADATPDPERWLPMKDRAAFKAKKAKKNAKGLGMSTQGGAIDADTEKKLNLNMASTSVSASPSPSPAPVPAGKKGKKKGKK